MRKRTLAIGVRVAVYVILFGVLAFVPPEMLAGVSFCPIYHLTGRQCLGCGMTRAFCSILHGRLGDAMRWNPFSTVVFPLCVFLVVDEGIALVSRLCNRNRRSILERIFGLHL